MNRASFLYTLIAVGLLSLLFSSFASLAQEGEVPLSLEASGSASWILKYGFGDAKGLLGRGYSDQLVLEQALAVDTESIVDINWPVSGLLLVSAQLDNRKSENLQSLKIKLDSENLDLEFGDFTTGGNSSFTTYNKKLKGLRLEGILSEDLSVTGVLSRVEGISKSTTFRGNTSLASVTFSLRDPESSWLEQPYLLNIRGLQFYRIENFVEGFTKVSLSFNAASGLKDLLISYDLGYLFSSIKGESSKEIESAKYKVVFKEDSQYLILTREAADLLRGVIKEYIDDYNQANNLTGEDRKEYPVHEGTDYELGLLKSLIDRYVELEIDGAGRRLDSYEQKRFYYLGHSKIDPDSVKVEVKTAEGYLNIEDPSLVDYEYHLFPDEGIIEFDFPEEFFSDLERSEAMVSFNYAVSGGIYILGLSVVKGSEKVYLNGKLLQRMIDYAIDYETGALILFKELGKDDLLRIDYEIFRGGLGGFTEYKRNFSGISFVYEPADFLTLSLDLLQAADDPSPNVDKTQVEVMPNNHIVGGIGGKIDLGGFQVDLEIGYNINRFPFDDNRRMNRLNRINVILPISHKGRGYVLFGHQNGLTVFDGQRWESFGIREGLAGRSVYDVAVADDILVFATDSGISLLKLEGEAPFAILSNWRRFYEQDGLASNTVHSLLIRKGTLWLGTAEGLNRVSLGEIEEEDNWVLYKQSAYPVMVSDQILKVTGDDQLLYLGTDKGLMIFDPLREQFTVPRELEGLKINDMKRDGETVYVATDLGIRIFCHKQGCGWLPTAEIVRAIALHEGEIWYGTPNGLYKVSGPAQELEGRTITALDASARLLWIGSEALPDYKITVWERCNLQSATIRSYNQDETQINGRDEHRFDDIPASEHTDRGWVGRLSLSQRFADLKVEGLLEGISPKFTTLEGGDRQDIKRWELGGSYSFTPDISLGAKHSASLLNWERAALDPFERKSFSVEDSLEFSLDLGPQVRLGYSLERIDNREEKEGFDQARSSLTASISESFLDDRLSILLSYERVGFSDIKERGGSSSQDHKLVGEVNFQMLEGLSVSWTYTSPVKISRYGEIFRRYGHETNDFSVSWSGRLPFVSVDADYSLDMSRRVPGGDGDMDDDAVLNLKFERFDIGDLKLYPRGTISLNRDGRIDEDIIRWLFSPGETLDLIGEMSLTGELGEFKSQLTYKREGSFDERSQRDQLVENTSFYLNYTGFKNWKPGFDFRNTITILAHPWFGKKRLESRTATVRLNWNPGDTWSSDLSLSQTITKTDQESTVSYSARDVTSFKPFSRLSTSLELTGNYKMGHRDEEPLDILEAQLILKGGYTLGGEWSASMLGGYILGIDNLDKEDSYQSFIASLQVTTTF